MKAIVNWFFGMVKFWKGYENKQSSDNPRSKVSGADKVMEAVRKKPMKKVPDDTLVGLEDYLMSRFCFRFNRLTEETEFKEKNAGSNDYRKVTQRNLNTFCIHARREGIDCWDRDVTRFLYSEDVEEYHPFLFYMHSLPEWDGTDRLTALAERVSSLPVWVDGFHRWMLGMAAQWMGMDNLHANSVAPILVSETQGKQKSTFCKLLMPAVLQRYYTDSFDLTAQGQCERKLSDFGLINLDEMDKYSSQKMASFKNLIQMSGLNIRKAYQKNFDSLSRLASFIGTSNQKDLLTDPTGSRRFLCVELTHKIDCSPLEYDQIYAQLKAELSAGERCWFTSEEEAVIMEHNKTFYKTAVEEDVFYTCFRLPANGEKSVMLRAADIFRHLRKHNPAAMRGKTATNFGKVLMAMGVERVHTRNGNVYPVIFLDD